ncbi:MAG: gliding motility-associated C-terminal domain-containing protein, partial [Calditrichota bacterium]
ANLKAPVIPGDRSIILTGDENGETLRARSSLWVPYPRQSLLFNEVFSDPSERYPSEFVEVVNITENPVTLDRLQLQVGNHLAATADTETFQPGEYYILGEHDLYDGNGVTLVLPGWNSLPNSGGMLLLEDRYGCILDSLTYDETWPLEPGRSLERIHLKPGEHSPANWRVSLDPNGATPGLPNSLYLPEDSLVSGWTVGPTPFSPNDDGADDLLRIRYTGRSALQYVTLQIYDPAGRLIQSLAQDDGAGTTALWLWDGNDQTGDPAPIGVYVLYIEYTTTEGQSREKLERVILAKPL